MQIYFFFFQAIASSEDEARKICASSSCEVLLIGSKTCFRINFLLSLPHEADKSISRIASISHKCFLSNIGFNGLVLSRNDNIVVLMEGNEYVVQIKQFLFIRYGVDAKTTALLIEGFIIPFNKSCEGETDVDIWSGFPKVKLQPNDNNSVIVLSSSVKRKVMLYKHGDQTSLQTVVDYDRQLKDVPGLLVPVFPEIDDMLLIQGENQGDIWYGRALSVDLHNKTVEVYFYVEKNRHPNRFVRENLSRQAKNTVFFDSIIGIANGQWINSNTWQKLT